MKYQKYISNRFKFNNGRKCFFNLFFSVCQSLWEDKAKNSPKRPCVNSPRNEIPHLLRDCKVLTQGRLLPPFSFFLDSLTKPKAYRAHFLSYPNLVLTMTGTFLRHLVRFGLVGIKKEGAKKKKCRSSPKFRHCYALARLEKLQQSDTQLSERIAFVGIMGTYLRGPLKPSRHHNTMVLIGLKGGRQLGHHYAERRQFLEG